jgi:hypothetical protein
MQGISPSKLIAAALHRRNAETGAALGPGISDDEPLK